MFLNCRKRAKRTLKKNPRSSRRAKGGDNVKKADTHLRAPIIHSPAPSPVLPHAPYEETKTESTAGVLQGDDTAKAADPCVTKPKRHRRRSGRPRHGSNHQLLPVPPVPEATDHYICVENGDMFRAIQAADGVTYFEYQDVYYDAFCPPPNYDAFCPPPPAFHYEVPYGYEASWNVPFYSPYPPFPASDYHQVSDHYWVPQLACQVPPFYYY